METKSQCPFYRSSGSPAINHRPAYCEFDCTYAICDGEVKHCGKLHGLRQYLMGRDWIKVRIKGEKTKQYLERHWEHKEVKTVH